MEQDLSEKLRAELMGFFLEALDFLLLGLLAAFEKLNVGLLVVFCVNCGQG